MLDLVVAIRDILNIIIDIWPQIAEIGNSVTATVTGAGVLTALTKTPERGSKLRPFYQLIEFAGLNIGRAKDPGKASTQSKEGLAS